MRHAANLIKLGVHVIGFDPSDERRRALEELGGQAIADRDLALRQAESVVICSPNGLHAQDLHDSLSLGKGAFVEKPVACSPEEFSPLLDLAASRKLVLFPGHNLRLHPVVEAARRWLAEHRIGKPLWGRFQVSLYLPSFRPWQDHKQGYAADPRTGGVIFDNLHEIDLAHNLLGSFRVVACQAVSTGSLDIAADDCADILLRHGSGAVSSLHLDLVTRPRLRRTEIAGTTGRMDLNLDSRKIKLFASDGSIAEEIAFPGSYADDYVEEMAMFLRCLDGRAQPPCPPQAALDVLEGAVAARRAAGLPSQ